MKKLLICLLFSSVAVAQPIVTESTSNSKTKVESPPPSAISPSITTINNKMCSSGAAALRAGPMLSIEQAPENAKGGPQQDINNMSVEELLQLKKSMQ